MPRKNLNALPITETHPDKIKFWDYSRNTIKPSQCHYCDNTKVWWRCEKRPTCIWKSKIAQRVAATNHCPKCYQSKVRPGNTLKSKFPDEAVLLRGQDGYVYKLRVPGKLMKVRGSRK